MKIRIIAAIIFALFISNTALAENQKPSMTKTKIVKQELTVLEINHEERLVKVQNRSGFVQVIEVDKEARNLAQVVVGDVIQINSAETIQIKAFGADAIKAGKEVEAIFARTPEGQKPGVAAAGAVTFVVTIASIDLENSLVTLKDNQGNTRTLKPRLPSNLKKVKVGDKVAISFAKAKTITVKERK